MTLDCGRIGIAAQALGIAQVSHFTVYIVMLMSFLFCKINMYFIFKIIVSLF